MFGREGKDDGVKGARAQIGAAQNPLSVMDRNMLDLGLELNMMIGALPCHKRSHRWHTDQCASRAIIPRGEPSQVHPPSRLLCKVWMRSIYVGATKIPLSIIKLQCRKAATSPFAFVK